MRRALGLAKTGGHQKHEPQQPIKGTIAKDSLILDQPHCAGPSPGSQLYEALQQYVHAVMPSEHADLGELLAMVAFAEPGFCGKVATNSGSLWCVECGSL